MSEDPIHDYLEFVSTYTNGHVARFIREHGQRFEVGPLTFRGKRRKAGMCYMNATQVMLRDPSMRYVEGMCTVHGVPIDHAWNVDADGNLIDTSIAVMKGDPPNGRMDHYFGVVFSREYVMECMLKNRVYGLLGYASKTRQDLLDGKAKWREDA